MSRKWCHLLFLLLFIPQAIFFLENYLFHINGYAFAVIEGKSMFPTLKDGQKVIINYNIPEGNLTGEILIFSDQYICHRCIKDEGEWLTFKGDNSEVHERATRDELRAIFIKVSENQLIETLTH